MKHCRTWLRALTFLLVACYPPSVWADLKLPVLKSGTVTYSNVTVFTQTEHDLYISHAQGMGNVKISTLDDASLRALGLKGEEKSGTSATIMANARGLSQTMGELKTSLGTANLENLSEWFARLKESASAKITPQMMWAGLAVAALLYLFACFCLKLICHNAGAPTGVLIWLPLLQMLPLFRAAKMSGGCFLLFLIPPVTLIMLIWWAFRIAKACGKSSLVAILLILPVTTVFAFLYLAFSKGQPQEQVVARPIRLEGLLSSKA